MRTMKKLMLVVVVTLLGVLPGFVLADEAKCDTVITSAPYVINAQGHYCLGNDVTYFIPTGAAITINANSVVLDLAGYKIGGQAAGLGTQAYGVYVTNRSTVVVKNGLIRGFLAAVVYEGGSANNNNVVENIRTDGNTQAGIFINNPGTNNTVRNCQVSTTGGSTATTNHAIGIAVYSANSFVFNNTVTDTTPVSGGTFAWGLIAGTTGFVVMNNQVFGVTGTNAYCFGFVGNWYRDNIASGCTTPYSGGIDIGNNYP